MGNGADWGGQEVEFKDGGGKGGLTSQVAEASHAEPGQALPGFLQGPGSGQVLPEDQQPPVLLWGGR